MGKYPFPPLPTSGESPAPQLPESSLLLHDVNMHDQPAMASEEQLRDLRVVTCMVASGVDGEPSTLPPSGESMAVLAQDVVMLLRLCNLTSLCNTGPDDSTTV